MKIGEIAYRKAQEKEAGTPDNAGASGAAGADGSAASSSEDDVIDADFTSGDNKGA